MELRIWVRKSGPTDFTVYHHFPSTNAHIAKFLDNLTYWGTDEHKDLGPNEDYPLVNVYITMENHHV